MFFIIMKPIHNICQIVHHELLVKNSGSVPHESPPFGQKCLESHELTMEARPKKLRFTGNDENVLGALGMLSSKMAKMN